MTFDRELVMSGWTLDKRVPAAVVITVALQFLGFLVYATRLDARVETLEKTVLVAAQADITDRKELQVLSERLTRVEEGIKNSLEYLRRIEDRARRGTMP